MADAGAQPAPPPAGRRARGPPAPHEAGQGAGVASGARAAARRAARLPASALQALPSVSLPDDSSTSTLVLFVLLVVVINSGLLHTLLWGLFMGMLLVSCLRVVLLLALVHTQTGALRAALAGAASADGAADLEAGSGAAAAPGADGRVNPVMLQMQLLGRELTERDYTALLALDENGGGGAPRRGVPRAALEAMPTHAFRAGGTEAEAGGGAAGAGGPTCAVCLEDPAEGDTLRTLPCLHLFHAACIDRWLEASDLCPVCKHRVLPPSP